jgi:hypothetical protein
MVSWIWEYTRACLRKEGVYGEDQRGDHRRVECASTLLDDTDRCQGHSLRFEVAVDIEFHITDRRLSIRGGNMRAPRHPHSGAFSHYSHHRLRSYLRSTCPIPYLSWNLNHRAVRRRMQEWVAAAIEEKAPDVVVLTEYGIGLDHASLLDSWVHADWNTM